MQSNKSNNNRLKTLLISDSQLLTRVALEICATTAINARVLNSTEQAMQLIPHEDYALLLLASNGSDDSILQKLKYLLKNTKLPVLLLSETENTRNAITSLKAGAIDYLVMPKERDLLISYLFEAKQPKSNNNELNKQPKQNKQFIATSPAISQTLETAEKIAPTTAPVMIIGKSGAGKELIAETIHNCSFRSNMPFIKVNCAALSDSLLESELFGHEKGAFTGALTTHTGRFERANGGTILLDEITETGPRFQAHLLRVLEQQCFERVGGLNTISVDIRIISTTNKSILEEIKNGKFREDLYYRLSGIKLHVPPLKERHEDIEPLIWHFIKMYAHENARAVTAIDGDFLSVCLSCDWPGNVRQLRNVIRTALALGDGTILSFENSSWLRDELITNDNTIIDKNILAGRLMVNIEQQAILETLRHTEGNQSKAAKLLGISNRTLRDKVKRYRENESLESILD